MQNNRLFSRFFFPTSIASLNHSAIRLSIHNWEIKAAYVGLGGLGVTCSPRDPRFAVSNPAQVCGFFQDVRILVTEPQTKPEKKVSKQNLIGIFRRSTIDLKKVAVHVAAIATPSKQIN